MDHTLGLACQHPFPYSTLPAFQEEYITCTWLPRTRHTSFCQDGRERERQRERRGHGKTNGIAAHPEQLESETKTHSSIFEFESEGESLKVKETTATTQAYAQVHKSKMTTKNGPNCWTFTTFKLGCTRSHQVADLKSRYCRAGYFTGTGSH